MANSIENYNLPKLTMKIKKQTVFSLSKHLFFHIQSMFKYGRMGCDCGNGNPPDPITTPRNVLKERKDRDRIVGKQTSLSKPVCT